MTGRLEPGIPVNNRTQGQLGNIKARLLKNGRLDQKRRQRLGKWDRGPGVAIETQVEVWGTDALGLVTGLVPGNAEQN